MFLSLGSTCAIAGLWVTTGFSPLVTPVCSVWVYRGHQCHWPIRVLAIFSGWHPLIDSVQTSGFFKTPDPVLKWKPSDCYRKTGKGGDQLDSKATSLTFLSIQQAPTQSKTTEGWLRSTCLVKVIGNILFELDLSEATVPLKAQRAAETVKVTFIAQHNWSQHKYTWQKDNKLLLSPSTFEKEFLKGQKRAHCGRKKAKLEW